MKAPLMCLSCAYSKASLINVRFAKMERPGTAQAWQGEIIVGMTGLSLEWTMVATSLSVFKRVIERQDFGLLGGDPSLRMRAIRPLPNEVGFFTSSKNILIIKNKDSPIVSKKIE